MVSTAMLYSQFDYPVATGFIYSPRTMASCGYNAVWAPSMQGARITNVTYDEVTSPRRTTRAGKSYRQRQRAARER